LGVEPVIRKGDGEARRQPEARGFHCFRSRIPHVRSRGHCHGHDRECVRYDHDYRCRRMKVSEDQRVRRSGSDRSVRNGRTDPTPDHPLVRAPVGEPQQGRRVVAPQILQHLRTTLEVPFPALGPRAEVVSDVIIRN